MIRRCECGGIVMGNEDDMEWMCDDCGKGYTTDWLDLPQYYKIVILGKWNGPNHFVYQLGKELEKRKHEVVYLSRYDMFKEIPAYDLKECTENKKPIPLRPIEYYHSPDFIFVEQQYTRYDNNCKYAKVIYHHREYTHFPDLLNPDMILWAYSHRGEFYESYFPYAYSKIEHKAKLFCAVNMNMFKPAKKIYKGIIDIGWHIEAWRFQLANGPVAIKVIQEQIDFWEEAEKVGATTRFPPDIDLEQYKVIMSGSEATLIDGGYYGWYTRRVYEAAAMKTLMVIHIYTDDQIIDYRHRGLINGEHYIAIRNIEELKKVSRELELGMIDVKEITENAYEWVKTQTYKKRADKLLKLVKKLGL